MIETPRTVQFFGISGAGKGTQAALLREYLNRNSDLSVLHLEMGERLRGLASAGGLTAIKIGQIQQQGKLVPEFIPSHVLTTFFMNEFTGAEHVIFEGMRRVVQVNVLDEALVFYDRADYDVVLIDLSRDDAYERLRLRGRSDEAQDAVIKSRFDWYERETIPAVEELEKRGRKVHRIDGRPSIQEIHTAILTTLGIA